MPDTTLSEPDTDTLREALRDRRLAPQEVAIAALRGEAAISDAVREQARREAVRLVRRIRDEADPGLMEVFLAEYGLSTDEGVALMCLAEALLRVPDPETIDALIEDKIAPSEWSTHLGRSSSTLVNASTWGLFLTGRVLRGSQQGVAQTLRGAIRRLGEPVIRGAVRQAMRVMGHQFVLGEDIDEALYRGRSDAKRGITYSYDMLGEAALTAPDAQDFYDAYADAMARLAPGCRSDDIRQNPGISIKLSALHPRFEAAQRDRVMSELVPRVRDLARAAAKARMGLNIDAEEADRLDLTLDVVEAVLPDLELKGWDGFGVVVQAYGQRAPLVIDWLHALAAKHDRRIMVRLVKGAYWDTEIKRAQVAGLAGFPVYTRKTATDVSYLCCAQRLLRMTDRIYPQFATYNAHSVAAILAMQPDRDSFEFQRLHGMGSTLHRLVREESGTRLRIYAPVGAHRDLLAYLVRRLLENGANSSFVNRIVDETIPPEQVVACPFEAFDAAPGPNPAVALPPDIFAPRRNSQGWDIAASEDLTALETHASRSVATPGARRRSWRRSRNPTENRTRCAIRSTRSDLVGHARWATEAETLAALDAAGVWKAPAGIRAETLRRAADLYEAATGEFVALLTREAGKSLLDAIADLREAVDFLRYYADEAERLDPSPRGVIACVSPWNFPLAIFTGQLAAALAAGNAVVAKPAEATPLVAMRATELLHDAGVPRSALQLVPGEGKTVGAVLTSDPRVAGVCFTGSTATAKSIDRGMAATGDPTAPLIAETGGLNAMIVDSTALPEQAVRDILASSFQSAGQRCSALRMLYVQEDVATPMLAMLTDAMNELRLGDPWQISTDVGPVIDETARTSIQRHIAAARAEGRVIHELEVPEAGHFVGPALLRVSGVEALEREVFGPVLHVATFGAEEIDAVVDAVNASGYGLTFGLHTRIDSRVQQVSSRLDVGNIYVNRNQIGAVVGSQPFGGEGLSGTGPKAGGPHYVPRFAAVEAGRARGTVRGRGKAGGCAGRARCRKQCGGACLGNRDAGTDGGVEPALDASARNCPVSRSRRRGRACSGGGRARHGMCGGCRRAGSCRERRN